MQQILERTSGAVSPADFYLGRVAGHRTKRRANKSRKPAAGRRGNSRKPRRPDEATP
jgi:hypothetical protein